MVECNIKLGLKHGGVLTMVECQVHCSVKYGGGFHNVKCKGAQELDQHWINIGEKQCSCHLDKKITLLISNFFLIKLNNY